MAAEEQRGKQEQTSRQSGAQGGQSGAGKAETRQDSPTGIGSSQGQDAPGREESQPRERPSAGTPDIERHGGVDSDAGRGNSSVEDSLTGDPTGAYKERP